MGRAIPTELSIAVLVLVASFVFLDVPLLSSVLLGPVIVGMGAFGAVILRGVVKGFPITSPSLLGPGLMVGGPVALVIFNLMGRGTVGTATTIVLIAVAFLRVRRIGAWQPNGCGALWTLSQVLGMSALSMSWEFPELLPAAVTFFVAGFLSHKKMLVGNWLRALTISVCIVAIALSALLRQEYWWLVTDDYSVLELISQHVTRVGPLADWGVLNFSRYHWLSYGLSGLWNHLSGSPEVMTTLTKVTPAAYTISLSSSLILVVRTLRSTPLTALSLLPVWFILSINILDWSGTSTAGVYATLSAFVATAIIMLKIEQEFRRRCTTYALFLPIVTFTKFGSLFAATLILLLAESSLLFCRLVRRSRVAAQIAFSVTAMICMIPILNLTGRVTNGFSLTGANPGLGELSTLGLPTIVPTLAVHRLYLLVPLGLVLIVVCRWLYRDVTSEKALLLLLSFSSLSIFGILLDIIISGKSQSFDYSGSNRFMYFSGPMYFAASLAALAPTEMINPISGRKKVSVGLMSLLFFGAGLVWTWRDFNLRVWQQIGKSFDILSEVQISMLWFYTQDSRIPASIIAFLLLLLAVRRRNLLLPLLASTMFSVIALTIADRLVAMNNEFQRERGLPEITSQYGIPESRAVADWLKMHTDESDVIATNYLVGADFSLAIWSSREFLVLGPSFAPVYAARSIADVNDAIELSRSFGEDPTRTKAGELIQKGVRWFVVDRTATSSDFSALNWSIEYVSERFLVLKL